MKYTAIALAALASVAMAQPSARTARGGPLFPAPAGMTVSQGQDTCGDQASLSCCNQANYAGDTTTYNDGILSGLLGNLLGAGSGSEGLGLADQCSKVDLEALDLLGLNDLLNTQCEQNVACCQDSGASADGSLVGVALPCIALGSLL
ncbi:fungal hydrophobin [Aspergillus sclerotioniger CBS 115572]|uniref:Hydrophobin n=1 Tax=Aspergillus sclerotioniger CBS 115572 TaxID=1450535 RepID=A0A317WSC6_9EURO|nr:fungal hydrophobin [Aspergillus sclerotioniger CBS 115572]PWY87100.1 fungal hydrophobin [Aspergillus sclerotioniger CBS 115572]